MIQVSITKPCCSLVLSVMILVNFAVFVVFHALAQAIVARPIQISRKF